MSATDYSHIYNGCLHTTRPLYVLDSVQYSFFSTFNVCRGHSAHESTSTRFRGIMEPGVPFAGSKLRGENIVLSPNCSKSSCEWTAYDCLT